MNARNLAPGCMSCEILAGKRTSPGGVIYEDDYWHVDSMVPPVFWLGFLIVKLKRHCEHLAELTPEEAAALGPVVQAACQALSEVLKPAKVYVCSFGDGVKHIHLWVLPRPPEMRSGIHWVVFHLDVRSFFTRRLGVKRWLCSGKEVEELADKVRRRMCHQLPRHGARDETQTVP
jgi:diadenosine tetraphosphate (Ap4A) HIT family hydrolase